MKHYVGIDEVGRGPAAGPVTVCAVCWTSDISPKEILKEIKDSKKLSEKKREEWHDHAMQISSKYFIYEISSISADQVDKNGIKDSLLKASTEVLKNIKIKNDIEHVLSDYGLPISDDFSHTHIIKGDEKEPLIALASILAKVHRDKMMCSYAKNYPLYSWEKNKGYLTKQHIDAVVSHGITPLHRKTYLTNFIK